MVLARERSYVQERRPLVAERHAERRVECEHLVVCRDRVDVSALTVIAVAEVRERLDSDVKRERVIVPRSAQQSSGVAKVGAIILKSRNVAALAYEEMPQVKFGVREVVPDVVVRLRSRASPQLDSAFETLPILQHRASVRVRQRPQLIGHVLCAFTTFRERDRLCRLVAVKQLADAPTRCR